MKPRLPVPRCLPLVVVVVQDSANLPIGPVEPAEVGVFELAYRGSHHPRELDQRQPPTLDRPGGKRVAAVLDPAVLDPGRSKRRRPLAVTELL
jgi:hypothetical protein